MHSIFIDSIKATKKAVKPFQPFVWFPLQGICFFLILEEWFWLSNRGDFMETLLKVNNTNKTETLLWIDIIWISMLEASLYLFCYDIFISILN